jgi:acyl-CoA thioesterase
VSTDFVSTEEVARRCAETMWADDRASQAMGMRLEEVAPGWATIAMRVRDDMVNGHGLCHGGYVAALADSAFAFACNTYDDVTVGAGFDVTFVASARLGDELVAEACERARYGRSGLYDVSVRRLDGDVVAEFRGRSRRLGRPILTPNDGADPCPMPIS